LKSELRFRFRKRITLPAKFLSAFWLKEVVEFRPDLESLLIGQSKDVKLSSDDILILASLPLLKSLEVECKLTDEAVLALDSLKQLRSLEIVFTQHNILPALPTIGRRLVSLIIPSDADRAMVYSILAYCPNLESLNLRCYDSRTRVMYETALREGLRKLSKLIINGKCVRLGTSWEGY
jgi:hypothetical protein